MFRIGNHIFHTFSSNLQLFYKIRGSDEGSKNGCQKLEPGKMEGFIKLNQKSPPTTVTCDKDGGFLLLEAIEDSSDDTSSGGRIEERRQIHVGSKKWRQCRVRVTL